MDDKEVVAPATWEIRGAELWLVDPAGNKRVPSVEEIYNALVERLPAEAWIATSVDGLGVSRYPLTPSLTIQGNNDGVPYYLISASTRGATLELVPEDLERGHTIIDGIWYPVDPVTNAEVLELLRSTGIAVGPARSLKAFLAIRKVAAAGGPVEDHIAEQSISPLVFAPVSDDLPTGVKAKLYDYQLAGWRWLKFLLAEGLGGLLADEMGLGKTLQIISVLSDSGGAPLRPALIIAPGSLLENWRREIDKFASHLKVLKHHGPHRTGRPAELQRYDVVITSYDTTIGDNSLFNMIRWRVVILDEAQFIRNPIAQRTLAVKRLKRDSGLAVTGTPVENRLLDIWSIMDFVLPGQLGDMKTFEAQFTNNVDSAAQLEPLVSPLMLRRRVADVAQDLPPRIDIPQVLELDAHEAVAYDAERERINVEYGAAATLVALTSLRRFCAHPSLMVAPSSLDDPMSFSKFRRLDEIVEEIFVKGEKVIIFTSFTAMADLIARHIELQYRTFVGVIDGRLSINDRQPLIDKFSVVKGAAALVLNPKAGGAGLNITAANHVIHYNPEWNPAMEDQASARAYRRGQKLPVTVHRLLVADTVEDVVDDRLRRKREISGAAVIGVEGKDEDYGDIVAALSRSPSNRIGN
ncbi:DEAD/DEAH box helicase [Pseudomonas brassicacearum]|uniref:Serine/threonine protein phosphatase n=1 Tax=Pseudomonas brassicacearum TaxID=930166 RepID=A0A423J2Y4_9PSED|nr:DEAD/DEAH box helicase [Pseudomonas brassicacearum]RON32022.1 serine/threonine protein phosphatase [Pseudomonas brassicacearum]